MPALVTLTMQAQIEERAERSWKLRDMLHLGKLNVPGSAMDDDGYLMKTSAPPMQPTLVTRPTLVGKSNFSVVEVVSGKWVSTGMPNRKQKGPKNQKWLTKAIVRYCFAQCEAFFQDGNGRTYVGLRWYDQSGPDIIDATVLQPRLKLRPHDQPRSYSILPASCIHNGALLIANGAHHYAIMSPRELREYESFNTVEA